VKSARWRGRATTGLLVAGVPWYWGLIERGGGVGEDGGGGGQGIIVINLSLTVRWKQLTGRMEATDVQCSGGK
jgi:hypothetical protein